MHDQEAEVILNSYEKFNLVSHVPDVSIIESVDSISRDDSVS